MVSIGRVSRMLLEIPSGELWKYNRMSEGRRGKWNGRSLAEKTKVFYHLY